MIAFRIWQCLPLPFCEARKVVDVTSDHVKIWQTVFTATTPVSQRRPRVCSLRSIHTEVFPHGPRPGRGSAILAARPRNSTALSGRVLRSVRMPKVVLQGEENCGLALSFVIDEGDRRGNRLEVQIRSAQTRLGFCLRNISIRWLDLTV
jgi:hypothetical protein